MTLEGGGGGNPEFLGEDPDRGKEIAFPEFAAGEGAVRGADDLVVFRLIGEIEVGFLFFVAVAFAAEAVDHAAEAFLVRLAVGGVGRLRRRGGEDCSESGKFKKQ
jgi:hypothetical protein